MRRYLGQKVIARCRQWYDRHWERKVAERYSFHDRFDIF
jgi:hypothetical protein